MKVVHSADSWPSAILEAMRGSIYPSTCAAKQHADRYIALAKRTFSQRKGFFVVGIILACAFITVPGEALANPITDGFKAAGAALVSVAIAGILWLLNWLSVALLLLAVTTLKTVMAFVLQAAYTPLGAGEGSSITVAWEVVRDFTNMLFILILIAIAIGTMLMNFRISLPGQEKMGPGLLVKFFIVATLINFTPLLTGIVIDISNVLTKFFFDVAAGGSNAFITFNPFTTSAGDWEPTFNLDVAAGLAMQYGVAFIFNLVASLVLLTVAALLIVRVLALWLLVIFSPLAFAASILPQTKDYFGRWSSQFLQWAILPVPIGLFLWIAALILSTGSASCGAEFSNIGTEQTGGFDAPVNNVLQGRDGRAFCGAVMSSMALGTVIAGMFVSFSASAKGSGFVVSRAQKIQQGAPKWAGRHARRGAYQAAPGVARTTQKAGRGLNRAGKWAGGTPVGTRAGSVARKIGNAPGVRQGVALGKDTAVGARELVGKPALRLGGAAAAPAIRAVESDVARQKEAWKGIKDYDAIKGNFNALHRQAKLELRGDNKAKLIDLMATEHADDFAKLSKKEVAQLLKSVQFQSGAAKNALKVHPDAAWELAEAQGKNPAVELKKQVGKLTDKDIENTSSSSWANDAFVKEMIEQNKLSAKLYEKIGTKNLKAIQNLDESMRRIGQEVAGSSEGGIDEKQWERYLSENTDMARELREFTNSSPALKVLAGTNQVQVVDEAGNVVRNRQGRPVMRKEGVLYRKPNQGGNGGEEGEGASEAESNSES